MSSYVGVLFNADLGFIEKKFKMILIQGQNTTEIGMKKRASSVDMNSNYDNSQVNLSFRDDYSDIIIVSMAVHGHEDCCMLIISKFQLKY